MIVPATRQTIIDILRTHGAEYIAIFGSAARGQQTAASDVDILVRFEQDISLLDHVGITYELEDALKQKVDLVPERSLNKDVVPSVKKDLRVLYGKGQRRDLQ